MLPGTEECHIYNTIGCSAGIDLNYLLTAPARKHPMS